MRKDAQKEAVSTFALPPKPHVAPLSHTFNLATDQDIQAYYGRLFGFCIVPTHSPESNTIVQRLIDSIQNYYLKQVRLSQSQSLNNDVEQLFEKALAQTNEEIKQFGFDTRYREILKGMQAFVGLLRGEKLIMTTIGPMRGFLIRNTTPIVKHSMGTQAIKEQNYNEDQYKILSIIEPDPHQLPGKFSSIIAGDVHIGDKLFFCNPDLLSYFSLEHLKKYIVLLPGDSAFQQFKNELEYATLEHHLTGIIVDTQKQSNASKKETVKTLADSMHALEDTLHNTKQVLFPSLSMNQLSKGFSSFVSTLKQKKKKSVEETASTLNLSHEMETATKKSHKPTFSVPKVSLHGLQNIAGETLQKIKALPKSFSKKSFNAEPLKKLSKNKYVWLSLSVIVISFFVWSIFSKKDQVVVSQVQDVTPQLEAIAQDLTVVESRLIYGDEEKAREKLSEIRIKLDEIPEDATYANNLLAETTTSYQQLYDELNHLIPVAPVQLIDFQAGFPHQTFSMSSLVLLNDDLFAFTCHDIYKFAKDASSRPDRMYSNKDFCIKLAKPYNDDLLLLGTDNSFAIFDIDQKELYKLPADIKHNENIVDFQPFGSNLYYIDHNSNQIYKYRIGNRQLSSKQKWLKKDYSLSLTNSIAIDGSIYLLSSNADIARYYLGNRKDDFEFGNTQEPPLSHPQKIITNEDEEYPYLFILEPQTQRIIMIEKEDGGFIAQLEFSSLEDVQDITVDFETQTVYVLENNVIYTFDLPA